MSAPHAGLKKFPPLAKPTSPRLAALIGALTGGIGLRTGRVLKIAAAVAAAAVGTSIASAQGLALRAAEDAALREVAAQRAHLTAAVVSLDGRTRLGRDAQRLVPLASTMKILILEEAAHEIASGRLHAGTAIPLSTVSATYLPGTDGGAHAHALAAARKRGWLRHNTLSMRHVLDAMIEFSDNAATDTVLRMVDPRALTRRARALGQDVPLAPGGLFLSWGVGVPALAHPARGAAYDRGVQQLALRLARDPRFRSRVLAGLRSGVFPSAADQARFSAELAPRGSVAAYAELMRRILTRRDAADRLAASVLGWPLRNSPSLKPSFSLLAQKGGDLPGVLTVVEGVALRGRPGFITALFFTGLDPRVQAQLERDDAFDLVPLGIASRAAFRARAEAALGLTP
jgi:D-alanyl-D-alanine carboxypeptidase